MARINKDSKLWAKALEAYKEDTNFIKSTKSVAVITKKGHVESMVLMHELRDIKLEMSRLRVRSREIRRLLAGQKIIKGDYYNRPIKLYALKLVDNCWYIGMSRNPEKRFKKHGGKKGAMWTKLHPPIEIAEIRNTGLTNDSEVSRLEDEMTIEYARKYGIEFVRGGGYCQTKPRWPESAYEADLSWIV